MFVIIVITLLTLLSLAVDTYIYRRWMRRRIKSGWLKTLYIGHIVVLYIALLVALLFYRREAGADGNFVYFMMWAIFAFILFVIPKSIWALISLLDYPVGWIIKRHCNLFAHIGVAAGVICGIVMILGATVGRNRLDVKTVVIESEKLPEAFDGYRIVHFTDLHLGTAPKHMPGRLVEAVNRLRPDLVINSGDLVNIQSRELNDSMMSVIGGIMAHDGVVMVMGNHDMGTYIFSERDISPRQSYHELVDKVGRMDWRLLQNEAFYLHRGGDSIGIAGVGFPLTELHNGLHLDYGGCDVDAAVEGLSDSTFNVMVLHTPNTWEEVIATNKGDLSVAGHVHAMQFKLHMFGWEWSPAKFLYRHWSGLYTEGDKNLYVNDGLGCVMYPMRIGARPEVTVIELRRKH